MIEPKASEPLPITNSVKMKKQELVINGKRHEYYAPIIRGSLNVETGVLTVKQD